MLSGTIQSIEASDSSDNRGNQYQFITIVDQNTGQPNRGRIGSKNGYGMNDIGSQIQVDVENKQSDQGPYLYFKKHYDKAYGGQSAPQGSPQRPQQARQGTKPDDMVRIRSMALAYAKDLVVAEKITRDELASLANEFTAYIMTGQWIQDKPSQETNQYGPQHPEDDIPF